MCELSAGWRPALAAARAVPSPPGQHCPMHGPQSSALDSARHSTGCEADAYVCGSSRRLPINSHVATVTQPSGLLASHLVALNPDLFHYAVDGKNRQAKLLLYHATRSVMPAYLVWDVCKYCCCSRCRC